MSDKLKSIYSVEVFSVGTWNGDAYTESDLDEMVTGFNENKATLQPPLKLGHNKGQELLQSDGLPAAGWVGNLYRVGKKLMADFVDIPEKIYEILQKGAYKKVSAEIYWNIDVAGKEYSRLLAGVALLGADMPAVQTLNDILAMYAIKFDVKKLYTDETKKPNIKLYTFEGCDKMAEETKTEIEKLKEQNAKLAADLEKNKAEIEKVQEYSTADKKRIAELEQKSVQDALDRDVNELVISKVISPAMKEYVLEFLGDKKEYSIKEKKFTKAELLKEILKLHTEAKSVNTTEQTLAGEPIEKAKAKDAEIQKYMAEHKVDYSKAYRAVEKSKKA